MLLKAAQRDWRRKGGIQAQLAQTGEERREEKGSKIIQELW